MRLNLNRCSFLLPAYNYIKDHPGCCKKDVILGVGYRTNPNNTKIANETYSYRNSVLNRLITNNLVENSGSHKYILKIREINNENS